MGRFALIYLNSKDTYICSTCGADFALPEDIISKTFHGRHGKAYLFHQVVNVTAGPTHKRLLRTGEHEVADIFCIRCQDDVGWKYEVAYEHEEKYKEGKFILEKAKLERTGKSHQ